MTASRENVLLVCTGNICRSPMAMALLRSLISESAPHVVVDSAGLLTEGDPATPEAVDVMGRSGLDLSGHRSALMTSRLRQAPDLIVGMARNHVLSVVAEDPALLGRTFTLKELVRRAEEEGPRGPGESLQGYLTRIGEGRTPTDLMRLAPADDVEDPIGQGLSAYRICASEIEDLVRRLVALLWAGERSDSSPSDASHRGG